MMQQVKPVDHDSIRAHHSRRSRWRTGIHLQFIFLVTTFSLIIWGCEADSESSQTSGAGTESVAGESAGEMAGESAGESSGEMAGDYAGDMSGEGRGV